WGRCRPWGGGLAAPRGPWRGDALPAVDGHHERWDGGGYPYKRSAATLPIAARVTAVADAFETMTAARPYKNPRPVGEPRQEIARCAGHQFDPEVARAFLALSVPRLWVLTGPLTWLAQIPVLGVAAAQTAAAAAAPAVTAAAVVGSAMVAGGGGPGPAAPHGQREGGGGGGSGPGDRRGAGGGGDGGGHRRGARHRARGRGRW